MWYIGALVKTLQHNNKTGGGNGSHTSGEGGGARGVCIGRNAGRGRVCQPQSSLQGGLRGEARISMISLEVSVQEPWSVTWRGKENHRRAKHGGGVTLELPFSLGWEGFVFMTVSPVGQAGWKRRGREKEDVIERQDRGRENKALTGVASSHKAEGHQLHSDQGTCLGCRFSPWSGHVQEATS